MLFSKNRQNKIIAKNKEFSLKKRDEKERSFFGRLAFYFLLVLYVPVLIYAILFSSFMEIRNINIIGNKTLKTADILNTINETRSGKYFGLVPQNNYLLLSREKLSQRLTGEFKKIKNIEVSKSFPDSIRILIAEREALIVWCSGGPCYIIDELGYAYTPTDLDAPEVQENNLIQVIDSGIRTIDIGERVVSENYIQFLVMLRQIIGEKSGIRLTNEWKTPSPIAQEVEVQTLEGWRIIFSSEISPEKSIRTLETFLSEEIGEEKRTNLEYVDLRVENKVFYKIREEENESEDTNKTSADEGEQQDTEKDKKKKN